MGDAEITMHGAEQVSRVEGQNIVLSSVLGAQRANALRVQVGVEFALVGIETGGKAHERGRD